MEPGPDTDSARAARRDVARNRERILLAARAIFAEEGFDATIEDIAQRAHLGVATVYRHFGAREHLIAALWQEHLDRLSAIAASALEIGDPWQGFVQFMEQTCALISTDLGVRSIVTSEVLPDRRVESAEERLGSLVPRILERARESGGLRRDVEISDLPVISLIVGVAADFARETRPELWRRYLAIILDGLRDTPRVAVALPIPALNVRELQSAMGSWRTSAS